MRAATSVFAVLVALLISPLTAEHSAVPGGYSVEPWEKDVPAVAAELYATPRADRSMVPEVSQAIARHAYDVGLDPFLVTAVVRVENPWLRVDTASYAGAVGIMQVMGSVWGGSFVECGEDLTDVDVNVCFGTRILRFYLDRHDGDLDRALLSYSGCVRTPGCERYSGWVRDRIATP